MEYTVREILLGGRQPKLELQNKINTLDSLVRYPKDKYRHEFVASPLDRDLDIYLRLSSKSRNIFLLVLQALKEKKSQYYYTGNIVKNLQDGNYGFEPRFESSIKSEKEFMAQIPSECQDEFNKIMEEIINFPNMYILNGEKLEDRAFLAEAPTCFTLALDPFTIIYNAINDDITFYIRGSQEKLTCGSITKLLNEKISSNGFTPKVCEYIEEQKRIAKPFLYLDVARLQHQETFQIIEDSSALVLKRDRKKSYRN